METYISLLRGINVGGNNSIKMSELIELYSDLHFRNCKTYIQSGNVVFQFEKTNWLELAKLIETSILQRFQLNVPVIIFDKPELIEISNNNPFLIDRQEDTSKLHVTFLEKKPEINAINKINKSQYLPDEFEIINSTIYLFCPNGYGKTKLTNQFFENKLLTRASTRNWNTVIKLVEIINT